MTYKKPDIKKLLDECHSFNNQNPIGADVLVMLDGVDEPFATKTRSTAQILSGHSAVIWLENVTGCYLLDRVTSISKEQHIETRADYPQRRGA